MSNNKLGSDWNHNNHRSWILEISNIVSSLLGIWQKKKFIIPEDAPKEIHEAYKRKLELCKKYKEE